MQPPYYLVGGHIEQVEVFLNENNGNWYIGFSFVLHFLCLKIQMKIKISTLLKADHGVSDNVVEVFKIQ